MCFICDGGTEEQAVEEITQHIIETGWSVQGVLRQNGRLDWAYTIGLAERFDHPELVVTGMCCFPCAGNMLNQAARLVAGGRRPDVGEVLELSAPVRLGAVHPDQWRGDRFAVWLRYYETRPTTPSTAALQLIWMDDLGTWQDDPGRSSWQRRRLDRPPGAGLTARTGGPSTRSRHRHRRRRARV
jgi:hypothetical protein